MKRSILFFFIFCSSIQIVLTQSVWPEAAAESKPWTRWWWHGNSVTRQGITAELESFRDVGIGGVELTPIFGVIGDEKNWIDFLSDEWMNLFVHSLKEAERLGMKVDLATGTGWPFGGPWVDKEQSSKYILHRSYVLKTGEHLNEKIEYIQDPIFRRVNNLGLEYFKASIQTGKRISEITPEEVRDQMSELSINDILDPIEKNENMQKMAFDQIRFQESLPLISLMAYSETGQFLDLTSSVNESRELAWTAPSGKWNLYAVFAGYHGKMVERAAPGGEGNVIDHFSRDAIIDYLDFFDQSFQGHDISSLRAFFNDSYEVDDARGQSNWTPEFFKVFKANRGYDLREHFPALLDESYANVEEKNRVISDYRQTIHDLILTTFTNEWAQWAHKNNASIRNQSHGSPGNILDLYAASDIPEAEGTQALRIRFASSAAHVSGKILAASEAATWLNEHFLSDLSDLKQNVDNYLVNGVNHVVYHGTSYSPDEDAWPGRLFYAAIHMNERNPMWKHAGALNSYITRAQSILQSGKPDNDILLYFPAFDVYASPNGNLLRHFDGHGPEIEESQFGHLASQLIAYGFELDFISDAQILNLDFAEVVRSSGNEYKALVIPETQFMPVSTLKKLNELAAEGAIIIFQNNLPQDVPGLFNLEERQAALKEIYTSSHEGLKKSTTPDVSASLKALDIQPESIRQEGLDFIRRSIGEDTYYFITNWSDQNFKGWLTLNNSSGQVVIMDPMTGAYGIGEARNSEGKTEVMTKIVKGQSMIYRVTNENLNLALWPYYQLGEESIEFNEPWIISFKEGGPSLPPNIRAENPIFWTEMEQIDYHKFSGIATYATSFIRPIVQPDAWMLDLGEVKETARVFLNGKVLHTLVGPYYELVIPHDLLQKKNTLEIEVANKMANRIIDLDQNGIFWKKFYNINFPPNQRENLGPMRLFSAEMWDYLPSGVEGPVTLKALYLTAR